MTAALIGQMQPGPHDVEAAVEAVEHVKNYLARHPSEDEMIRLVVDDGAEPDVLEVPRGAVELLARILAHLAAGQGVSVVPSNAELTTQQAADMANVSRPFLIGLLEAGEIEYRKVGKHRRVRASSLMDYLRHDDTKRRDAADELTALTQEIGLS